METKWNIEGTYCEACSCDVGCPCVFLSPPTNENCEFLIAWHIEKGNFGDVSLKGLNVALSGLSSGNMQEGNWTCAVYLDDQANSQQQEALTQIFSGEAGGFFEALSSLLGEVLGIKTVPIEYEANGNQRSLRIPKIAAFEIEAIAGAEEGQVTINNEPFGVTPGITTVVAKSKRLVYEDYDFNWEISGKSGYFSPFSYEVS